MPAAFFRILYLVGQNCLVILRRLDFGLGVSVAAFISTVGGIALGYAIFGTMEGAVGVSNVGAALSFAYGLFLIHQQLKQVAAAETSTSGQ